MTWSRRFSQGAVLGLVLLLAGCSTYAPPASAPAPVEQQPKPEPRVISPPAPVPRAPERQAPSPASAALRPLLDKAAQASAHGDYEQALALLERAQRIDPGSAEVYLGMAQAQRAKGDATQAGATAERGLRYCTSNAQCNALRAFTR